MKLQTIVVRSVFRRHLCSVFHGLTTWIVSTKMSTQGLLVLKCSSTDQSLFFVSEGLVLFFFQKSQTLQWTLVSQESRVSFRHFYWPLFLYLLRSKQFPSFSSVSIQDITAFIFHRRCDKIKKPRYSNSIFTRTNDPFSLSAAIQQTFRRDWISSVTVTTGYIKLIVAESTTFLLLKLIHEGKNETSFFWNLKTSRPGGSIFWPHSNSIFDIWVVSSVNLLFNCFSAVAGDADETSPIL